MLPIRVQADVTRQGRIFALVVGVVALALVGAACAARVVVDQRAGAFESRCEEARGETFPQLRQRFDDRPILQVENEVVVSYQNGWAGRTGCTLELRAGHVARVQTERWNEFDHCTDPRSYPRRHWICSIARIVVP